MKIIYLLLTVFSFTKVVDAQVDQMKEKTMSFIKLWGFLKYFHPVVSDGKLDWDEEFMNGIRQLPQLKSKKELNGFFMQRITSLGKIPICKSCKDTIAGGLNYNLNINWINDTSAFTPELIEKLKVIRNNRNQRQNHYAYLKTTALVVRWSGPTFENEKAYPDSIFPDVPMRILTLARYWNIINYYYPYKYVLDQDWDTVLAELTKKFYEVTDTLSYHLAILEMTRKISDSHSGFITPQISEFFGKMLPPFLVQIIDEKAVVIASPFPDSSINGNVLQPGDVILAVDDVPVKTVIDQKLVYMQGSNEATKLRNLASYLLKGKSDSIKLMYDRHGRVATKIFRRYSFNELTAKLTNANKNKVQLLKPWRIYDDNIGYINLGRLQPKQVDNAMKDLMETKGLILDVRNYPASLYPQLGKYLNIERKAFAKLLTPDLSFPGVMKHSSFQYTGKNQEPVYKGKVVLMVNEQTQSRAEFTVMALQTGRDVITIGSQTAGADGDSRKIPLPGGFLATITGIGMYYPDGKETQRVGIVPDIEVKPTIESIRSGRDEVLEQAKKIVNGNQKI